MTPEEEIELLCQVMEDIHKAKKEIFKRHGLNFNTFKELRGRVSDAFPSEGITRNGFRFAKELRPIRVFKEEHAVTIDHQVRISIHEAR
jgi:hypothetical protein